MPNKSASLLGLTWALVAALLVSLCATHYLAQAWPALGSFLFALIILGHIAAPLYILDRLHLSPRAFNLYAHRLESLLDRLLPPWRSTGKVSPDYTAIKLELIYAAKLLVVIVVPYALAYYFFYWLKAHHTGTHVLLTLVLPPHWGLEFLMQIGVVALPEEFFYRGFLQSSLQRKWPANRAIIITNIIFALGHFVGGFAPHRLLTFFPGLIFSWLVYRRHSLLSAILFHAIFNILGQILSASITLARIN